MVRPAHGLRIRKRKWRDHCATCGKRLARASTWAYCSKACEANTRFAAGGSLREDQTDRYLELATRLEGLPDWHPDRRTIEEQMRELQRAIPQDDERETFASRPDGKRDPEWWTPHCAREHDRMVRAFARGLLYALRLGEHLGDARAHVGAKPWRRMFRDHPEAVDDALPIACAWARELVQAAQNQMVAASRRETSVPHDQHVVYVLVRQERGALRRIWPAALEQTCEWLGRQMQAAERKRTEERDA